MKSVFAISVLWAICLREAAGNDCTETNMEYFLKGFEAGIATRDIKCNKDVDDLKKKVHRINRGGQVFTRWGRKGCTGNGTELIYSGFVAGSLNDNQGAAVNYQCMPMDPQFGYLVAGYQDNEGILVGAEYSTGHVTDERKGVNNKNVPCAVCRLIERGSLHTIPGNELVKNNLKSLKKKVSKLDQGKDQMNKELDNLMEKVSLLNRGGGHVFTRWGRKGCPGNGTELIYSGFVAGSINDNQGAAVNYQCMSMDPQFGYLVAGHQDNEGILVGAEYSTGHVNDGRKNVNNKNVPCAVCRLLERGSLHTIPGRKACYKGWHVEYSGYWRNKAATEYICVDADPEALTNHKPNSRSTRLYPVETYCPISLPCPPYHMGSELTCVVCSL